MASRKSVPASSTSGGRVRASASRAPAGPPPPATPASGRLALRPMARVQRIALFEREVRERLSPSALEAFFAAAEVISEGQRAERSGREAYFGSTMLTIDLEQLAPVVRDACDAGTAQRLAALMQRDPSVTALVKGIAARETARLAGVRPRAVATEIKIGARGTRVFIDVDVEAPL